MKIFIRSLENKVFLIYLIKIKHINIANNPSRGGGGYPNSPNSGRNTKKIFLRCVIFA